MRPAIEPIHLAYGALLMAVASEVAGWAFIARSEQFTRLGPSLAVLILYGIAFYFLSHALKLLPLGIAYALWSAFGIVLTAIIGLVVFRQALDAAALIGIGLIISGVIVIQAFSKAIGH